MTARPHGTQLATARAQPAAARAQSAAARAQSAAARAQPAAARAQVRPQPRLRATIEDAAGARVLLAINEAFVGEVDPVHAWP